MNRFRVEFKWSKKRAKQWIDVILWDVHPTTFDRWGGGRWAYFEPKWENPRQGFFGELHMVKSGIREDTVAHELLHVAFAWYFAGWVVVTPNNEETFCERADELVRKFYREYRKNERLLGSNRSGTSS